MEMSAVAQHRCAKLPPVTAAAMLNAIVAVAGYGRSLLVLARNLLAEQRMEYDTAPRKESTPMVEYASCNVQDKISKILPGALGLELQAATNLLNNNSDSASSAAAYAPSVSNVDQDCTVGHIGTLHALPAIYLTQSGDVGCVSTTDPDEQMRLGESLPPDDILRQFHIDNWTCSRQDAMCLDVKSLCSTTRPYL